MNRLLGLLGLTVAIAVGVVVGLATKSDRAQHHPVIAQHRGSSCVSLSRLTAADSVPAWRMGAVHFASDDVGYGLSAAVYLCDHRTAEGDQSELVRARPRLAMTTNGGRSWQITGAPLPDPPGTSPGQAQQILVTSPGSLTVLDGEGHVFETTDAGESWQRQRLPSTVLEIVATADDEFAVSVRGLGASARVIIERGIDGTGHWEQVTLPPRVAHSPQPVQLLALSPTDLLLDSSGFSNGDGRLYRSSDDGTDWTGVTEPRWRENRCDTEFTLVAAAGPARWWLLCIGGAGAGSSTKGLLETTDAGRHWVLRSAVDSLTAAPTPGTITTEGAVTLGAGSATRLWLSLTFNLAESGDGGRRWLTVHSINTQSSATSFDVLNAQTAWLEAPGAGLWRTTDGTHWTAVGALNTP